MEWPIVIFGREGRTEDIAGSFSDFGKERRKSKTLQRSCDSFQNLGYRRAGRKCCVLSCWRRRNEDISCERSSFREEEEGRKHTSWMI
jgi:hypothetical protein